MCYRSCLEATRQRKLGSVAFPLISGGSLGFPQEAALEIATATIREFLMNREMQVYLVVYDRESFALSRELHRDIQEFIDQRYVDLHPSAPRAAPMAYSPLRELVEQVDESFSQMLLRKTDEKGMTDVACYKKANIDRKLFSKIRKDIHYRPRKTTALAFAVALELSLSETRKLLEKAGCALSRSSKGDIIVEYFIQKGQYDIFEINEALFEFDQSLLGG